MPERFVRASDFATSLDEANNPEWKTVAYDEATGEIVVPNGSVGFRWGEKGKWNLEERDSRSHDTKLRLSLADVKDELAESGSRISAIASTTISREPTIRTFSCATCRPSASQLKDGETLVASVYDLFVANYGVDRGFGGEHLGKSYDDVEPYTPAWAEKISGVPRDQIITVAREFALNAEKTGGRSMVIVGAGLNHWYHMDMNYRGIINMLVMCGCVGQSGGGWSHYVGQEKLRPQSGWTPLAFALDWGRPPRQMNSTSAFYAHTDQWRYETLDIKEILSPTAPSGPWDGALIDYNVRAERMGWLPSAPQLQTNPLEVSKLAAAAGLEPKDYVAKSLKSGDLQLSCDDPDNPKNWPRNLFVWRSNLLGASGKGHEYFLKHLLGTKHGVMGKDLGEDGKKKPMEVKWHEKAPEGKLDLLVTLDFRMSTTCMYSDIVLPTATWYEKNDLNTSDMHPFIHPLSAAIDPVWESRSDWDIYKGIAEAFSKVSPEVLGVEKDVVLTPIMHDSPGEIAQPFDVKDWKKGEIDPIPGKTMPAVTVVERDYPNLYKRFTSLGPLMNKLGNGGKGMSWNTDHEVDLLKKLNGIVIEEGASKGLARIDSAIDACEVILSLAPETNGEVAVKAWASLEGFTGRNHIHLAIPKEDEKIRFRDIVAQPRKIISSPIWSGLESEKVCYNAGYTNVHELIPWRTLTGRQQLYQDHLWMRAFGEGFCVYRPPIDTKTIKPVIDRKPNGNASVVLNFITPHQKWGIHSTYTDNLLMLTLSRGGPIVWISEIDAKGAGIVDNDWIEAFNTNGALVARAVVSQRVKQGMCMMYHAQEKIVNVPGSEQTGQRGGIHNSVTRVVLKPTHMIGGYAQQSYGFNYYGTVGSNRDEFVIIRKMSKIDWLDTPDRRSARHPPPGGRRMKIRAQIAMVLNLDKCIGCHTCSVTCKNVWTSREGMEYAWFNNVETKPGIGYPKDWENQARWKGGWKRKRNGSIEPRIGGKWRVLANIFANPDLPEIDDYYEPFTFDYEHLQQAPEMSAMPTARPRSLISGERMEKIEWGPNWEEILGGEFAKRSMDVQLRRRAEGHLRPVRKHLHDVSAAAVRALPQPGLRRGVPVGRDLQARGRRHRPDRPGQVPRLADVRLRLPVQEDLLQLVVGQIGKVHLLLSAHRGRPADGVLGNLRRPHPLSRRGALRRRPDRGGRKQAGRARSLSGPARHLPQSERSQGDRGGRAAGHPACLARGRQDIADLEDGDGMEGRLPAASGIPHLADGLVCAAAVADHLGGVRRQDRVRRRNAGRQVAAHSHEVSRQPVDRGRREAGDAGAGAHAGDARLHAGEDHRRRCR